MTPLACFTNQDAASQAEQLLEKQGFDAGIHVESHADGEKVYVVRVSEHNLLYALLSLREGLRNREVDPKAPIHCPSCESIFLEFPARPRHSATAYAVETVAEATHLKHKSFFCRECKHTWHSHPAVASRPGT